MPVSACLFYSSGRSRGAVVESKAFPGNRKLSKLLDRPADQAGSIEQASCIIQPRAHLKAAAAETHFTRLFKFPGLGPTHLRSLLRSSYTTDLSDRSSRTREITSSRASRLRDQERERNNRSSRITCSLPGSHARDIITYEIPN